MRSPSWKFRATAQFNNKLEPVPMIVLSFSFSFLSPIDFINARLPSLHIVRGFTLLALAHEMFN